MSERQAAGHFGISCASVKKMMSLSVPPGYQRTAEIKRPKMDGFTGFIVQSLHDNLNWNRKQRHTARHISERLRNEHQIQRGYSMVKNYVRDHGPRSREMFVPLAHPPGHAQADFGEAMVAIGSVEQKAYSFALDLPYSDACFVRAYPAAVSEAWVDGHVSFFAFFGRVPQSIFMTTTDALLRRSCRTVRASGSSCSASSCRATSFLTALVGPAKAMTRVLSKGSSALRRFRGLLANRCQAMCATSWCLSPALRHGRP